MLAESEKVQIVSNRNLVDHHMKGIEYASCFEMRHLISFLNVDCLDPVINNNISTLTPMAHGKDTLLAMRIISGEWMTNFGLAWQQSMG